MEVLYYTIVAACLYFVSDWILDRIEVSRGERFKNRSIIFFIIILILSVISFGFMKYALIASDVAPK